ADRFCRNQIGLELPPFVSVRRALRGYVAASEYAAAHSPESLLGQRLAELADLTQRLDAAPTQADAHSAGKIVAWLEPLSESGAALAGAVRTRYGGRNCLVQASSQFVNVLLGRNVEEQTFIAQTVLGSYTEGVALTRAQVRF